ncbi:MAG: hypothetical protein EOS40_00070 [Mesorhizobium sp.]|nr:MAG: hypothetical protein EOS40_00070 [Mesorhizobium sp.]
MVDDRLNLAHKSAGRAYCPTNRTRLLKSDQRTPVTTVRAGQRLVPIAVGATEDIARPVIGAMLRDSAGHVVWRASPWHTGQKLADVHKGDALTIHIGSGSHGFSVAQSASDTHLEKNYEWQDNATVFDVVNEDFPYFIGKTALDTQFEIMRGCP